MKSVYFGGCWGTNIGNAFIDLGALHITARYNPLFFSEINPLYFRDSGNYLCNWEPHKPVCAFFSGMVTCDDFIKNQGQLCRDLTVAGVPIVFNGVGGGKYTDQEIYNFRGFMANIKVAGLISRDDDTYMAYRKCVPCYKGLDCAFFLSDRPEFAEIGGDKPYSVYAFDSGDPEPYGYNSGDPTHIVVHHQTLDGNLNKYTPNGWIDHRRTVISELPYEYIYLYAMSKITRSSRVHACIATLAFGGSAVLVSRTPRVAVFGAVGCGGIRDHAVKVDPAVVAERKGMHLGALNQIMRSII